ncbi:solute carrier organic anion transporter family member 1A2-like [Ischnura elegans]|uniref:solute carrier organic anion transporter family member 1A2-like n=1 Tax=Ischnura elegans TaxID=197161 RepID=UPI001ED8AB49|nr:solute carrier organic anion transporter family member 1A2-like [Ischnura elegans]
MSHRPIAVLRTNSMESRPFSRVAFAVPRRSQSPREVNISQVECGSGIIPKSCIDFCCPPERCNHAKLASPQSFAAVLIALLIIHGATESYLSEVMPTIVFQFNIPLILSEWILVGHKLSQVITGIIVASYADSNRPARLGGIIAVSAVACCTLITPYKEHGDVRIQTSVSREGPQLCNFARMGTDTQMIDVDKETCWVMVSILILYQFLAGVCATALMSHGITYIDDNVDKVSSPSYIGAAFGLGYVGRKLGSLLGWICLSVPMSEDSSSFTSVLGSWWLGWPFLSAFLIAGGAVICLFPNLMPSTAVKNAAKTILNNLREESKPRDARENEAESLQSENKNEDTPPDTSLRATLSRLIHNKMVMISLASSVFLEAGLSNYMGIEEVYLESVYQIPKQKSLQGHGMGKFNDPWISRLITGMLKAPLIAMTVVVSGLFISRIKPKATSIAAWAASMGLLSGICLLLTLFMVCPSKINGEVNGRLDLETLCNINCRCDVEPPDTKLLASVTATTAIFTPVCDEERKETYFSPCYAGCSSYDHIRDIQVFNNCSCIGQQSGNHMATLGACLAGGSAACQYGWIFFQAMLAFIQVIIASAAVGKLLLCLRCVLPQDKPMFFGLEMSVTSFFTFVPSKIVYIGLQDIACMSWTNAGTCQMHHSKMLALSASILTSCLLIISGTLMVWVAIVAKGLELYENDDDDEGFEYVGNEEMSDEDTSRNCRDGTPWPGRKKRRNKYENEEVLQPELQQMIAPDHPSNIAEIRKANSDPSPQNHENTTEL